MARPIQGDKHCTLLWIIGRGNISIITGVRDHITISQFWKVTQVVPKDTEKLRPCQPVIHRHNFADIMSVTFNFSCASNTSFSPCSAVGLVFVFIVSYSGELPQGRLYWLDRLHQQYFLSNTLPPQSINVSFNLVSGLCLRFIVLVEDILEYMSHTSTL